MLKVKILHKTQPFPEFEELVNLELKQIQASSEVTNLEFLQDPKTGAILYAIVKYWEKN